MALAEKAGNEADIKRLLTLLRSDVGFRASNAAVCTNSVFLSNIQDSFLSSQMFEKTCTEADLKQLRYYKKPFYQEVCDATRAIPCNTGDSWLRSFYSKLRTHEQCAPDPGRDPKASPESLSERALRQEYSEFVGNNGALADQGIRNIFFANIIKSFFETYKDKMISLRLALKDAKPCGTILPPQNLDSLSLPLQCEENNTLIRNQLTRSQVIEFVKDIESYAACVSDPSQAQSNFNPDLIKLYSEAAHLFKTHLKDMRCIPFGWVEGPQTGIPMDQASPTCMSANP